MEAVSLFLALLFASQISGPSGKVADSSRNSRYQDQDRYGQPSVPSSAAGSARQSSPATTASQPAAGGSRTFPNANQSTAPPVTAGLLPAPPEDPADVAKALVASFRSQPAGGVQPLTLERAVEDARDVAARRDVVHAYWTLWEADARRRIWADELYWLGRLAAEPLPGQGSGELTAAHVVAAVQTQTCTAAVDQAQQLLARWTGRRGPFLAVDSPLVGRYRTEYDRIFTGRSAPSRLRIIHESLPARMKALDARADAVWAASDALLAPLELLDQPDGPSAEFLVERLARYRQQRLTFVEAVRNYNLDIVEYAAAAAGDVREPEIFVSMLVKKTEGAGDGSKLASRDKQRGDDLAGQIVPTSNRSEVGEDSPLSNNELTENDAPLADALTSGGGTLEEGPRTERSVLRSSPKIPGTTSPAFVQPATFDDSAAATDLGSPPRTFSPPGADLPRLNEQPAEPASDPPAIQLPSASPPAASGKIRRTLRPMEGEVSLAYGGLLGSSPTAQASRLVEHWSGIAAQAAGSRGPTLEQALARAQSNQRERIIAAYWESWTETAARAAAQEKARQLEDLTPLTLEQRNRTTGAQDGLDVQAAWAAAAAEAAEIEARRVESVARLAQLLGQPGGTAFWPVTPPLSESPAWLQSSASSRTSTNVVRKFESVASRAARVAALDAARAELTTQYAQGALSLSQVVWSIERQHSAAAGLLSALQQANKELAEAALDDPQAVSASSLAQRLTRNRAPGR